MAGRDDPDRLIRVGRIAGAYGVKGEARVQSFTERPEALFEYGDLLDDAGRALAWIGRPRALKPDVFAVRFERFPTREAAAAARGLFLWARRGAFPTLTDDEDEFYIADLVGLDAVDEGGRTLGRVKAVQNFGAGDLLEIARKDGGGTVFHPFTRDAAPEVDVPRGRVVLKGWGD